ncbi:hypothetical protein PV10_07147 [Exophiala mesophila]|uniref:Ubiquitin-protein ligase sel1 n=1 Tax=Exophiala mesophila TaxID=212818 RepID=A0A0D1ZSG4_EXOME|nr:uncharacterized protein PV10_07147 [Exophiala mesophila]KIV89768.1 hypothetical protein PV10_07147 [Exophiala mesophila]
MELSSLVRRQYYDDGPGWWYSDTAYIIKWSVIAFLVIACLAFFLGAYLHARRRMAKGQPPLRYHRWLVPRRSRYAFAQAHPEHAHHFSFYRNARPGQYGYAPGQTYQMGHYGAPPPAYHEPEYVPVYTPAAPNKTDPNQTYTAPPATDGSQPYGAGPSQPPPAAALGQR